MKARGRWIIGGVVVAAVTCAVSAQQPTAPTLTRQQRTALQTLVRAVDEHTGAVPIAEADWPVHVLRASDGSHYVAFSINRVEGLSAERPGVLYVRLATRRGPNQTAAAERSAITEWLAGQAPIPVLPRRGIAFGEMPTFGAAGIGQRTAAMQAQNLQLLELERERAREKQEAQERTRKAALEGAETARIARPLLPFEDFDVRALAVPDASGAPVLRRSLTTGPGEYDLFVAWIDSAESAVPRVARRALSLPPASSTGLALSSVIVADDVGVRETAIPSIEQASHPYSIGSTEIVPARDHLLTPEERLALVVQVINARGNALGKPDVEVAFRVFRQTGEREELVGALASQTYNELTLPLDFDVAKGHPIFAAVGVPLRTFKRGDYRMAIAANDRVAGVGVVTDVTFTVATTPAALLAEAPQLAPDFDPKREGLPPAVSIMFGAIRASEGNDRDAVAAWQAAIDGGADAMILWPVMIDAHLRLRDTAAAIALAQKGLVAVPDHQRFPRQLARAFLMSHQLEEAVRVLESHLQRNRDDLDGQWLMMHALFAQFVSGTGTGATDAGRGRLIELASRYEAAKGPHAALASGWAAAVR